MILGTFESISRQDLEALVANRVSEGRTLEFKRDLPTAADRSRQEFLADITSFANAQGGDVLYGVGESKGIASEIGCLSVEDADKELLRWEDIILAGVEPRMPGIKLRWIDCGANGGVMLIRVPPSPIAPHRVTLGRVNRFYGRKSNGKYEMDTHELRDAFTASDALPTRLRALHLEAVNMASREALPVGLGDDPKAILSLIPVTYFRETRDLDITPENALAPHKPSGYMDSVRMIEGVLLYSSPSESEAVRSYSVTYRQGRIDMVWTIGRIVSELRRDEIRIVWPKRFEDGVIDGAMSGAARLAAFGVEGPWLVMVTVMGIKDYLIPLSEQHGSSPAWLDQATLPALMLDRMSVDGLRQLMRSFWLAFGEVRPDTPLGE